MSTDQLTDPRAQRLVAEARAQAILKESAADVALLSNQLVVEARLGDIQVTAAELATADLLAAAAHQERRLALQLDQAQASVDAPVDQPVDESAAAADADTVARAQAQKLYRRMIRVPLVCGTAAALIGQVFAFYTPVHVTVVGQLADSAAAWGMWMAAAIVLLLACLVEGMQLGLLGMARAARLDGDSPMLYRAGAWLITVYAVLTNLRHWSPEWTEWTSPDISGMGAAFGAASFLSVLGWEFQEHRLERSRKAARSRELFGEQRPIPPRPELGFMRRIVAPIHTTAAWAIAVRDRITDAEVALDLATAALDARAARKAAAKRDKSARKDDAARAKSVTAVRTDKTSANVDGAAKEIAGRLAKAITAKGSETRANSTPAKPIGPAKSDEARANSANSIPAKPVGPAKSDETRAKSTPAKPVGPAKSRANVEAQGERTQRMPRSVPDFPANWDEIIAAGVRCAVDHMGGVVTGAGKREELGRLVRATDPVFVFDNRQRGHLHQAVKRELERRATEAAA